MEITQKQIDNFKKEINREFSEDEDSRVFILNTFYETIIENNDVTIN